MTKLLESYGLTTDQVKSLRTEVETQMKNLELAFSKGTYNERVDYITQQTREMTGKASIALIQANLDTEAREARLNIIKGEAIQVLLKNDLITAQTNAEYQSISESKSRVQLNNEQIAKWANEILIGFPVS